MDSPPGSKGPTAMTFHNESDIQFQTGTQNFYGPVNYVTTRNETRQAIAQPHDQSIDSEKDLLASLAFPEMHDRRSSVHAPYKNTCEWFWKQPDVNEWLDSSNAMLWVTGKPGSGKSTIMAYIYDKLKDRCHSEGGLHLDFFFNARGILLQKTLLGMLRSLLNQILCKSINATLRSIICSFYEEKRKTFGTGEQKWEWQQPELEKLFHRALTMASQDQTITIFVDALDEAGTEHAKEIARFLYRISEDKRSSKSIKICASCRPYPNVIRAPALLIHVDKSNQHDILTFVRDHIDEDSHDQAAWQSLKEEIAKRANGMFQWAHLVTQLATEYVMDGYSHNEVRQRLLDVPAELNDMYEFILRSVVRERYRRRCLHLFRWVSCSERPLSLTELRHAMDIAADIETTGELDRLLCSTAVPEDRLEKLIGTWSGGLIEVSRSGSHPTVQIIHESVNDFMNHRGFEIISSLVSDTLTDSNCRVHGSLEKITGKHEFLLLCCLEYLYKEFKAHAVWDFHLESLKSRSPFLHYTAGALFWHSLRCNEVSTEFASRTVPKLQVIFKWWWRLVAEDSDSASNLRHKTGVSSLGRKSSPTLLSIASFLNIAFMVDWLVLQHDGLPDGLDKNGHTPMHMAAKGGAIATAKLLRQAGSGISLEDGSGNNPLIMALKAGHMDFVQWLVNEGSCTDQNAETLQRMLRSASQCGVLSLVSIITADMAKNNTADVVSQKIDESFALHAAAVGGHEKIAQHLIIAGASVHTISSRYGSVVRAALMCRDSPSRNRVMRLLVVEHGARLDLQRGDLKSWRGSRIWSLWLDLTTVELSIQANENSDSTLEYASELMSLAYWSENKKVLQTLFAMGMRIDHYALSIVKCRTNEDAICLLQQAGIDMWSDERIGAKLLRSARDFEDVGNVSTFWEASSQKDLPQAVLNSLLFMATWLRRPLLIPLLVSKGAHIDALDDQHDTPLIISLNTQRSSEMADELLIHGADPTRRRINGDTSLHLAALRGNNHVIDKLCELGVDVEAPNALRRTPLHAAILSPRCIIGQKNYLAVELLLSQGADPYTPDAFGWSPFDYARILEDKASQHILHKDSTLQEMCYHTRQRSLRKYISNISQTLLEASNMLWLPDVDALGLCLMHLSEFELAQQWWRLWSFVQHGYDAHGLRRLVCHGSCGSQISASFYMCKSCKEVFICNSCWRFLPFAKDQTMECREHDFLEIQDPRSHHNTLWRASVSKLNDLRGTEEVEDLEFDRFQYWVAADVKDTVFHDEKTRELLQSMVEKFSTCDERDLSATHNDGTNSRRGDQTEAENNRQVKRNWNNISTD